MIACHATIPETGFTQIQHRLIRANLKRRNRFIYAQSHAHKLAAVNTSHFSKPRIQLSTRALEQRRVLDMLWFLLSLAWLWKLRMAYLFRHSKWNTLSQSQTSRDDHAVTAKGEPMNTESSASAMTGFSAVRPRSLRSHTARTQISVTTTKIEYPRPPRAVEGTLLFKCPCCCQPLPIMFAEETHWK